MFRLEDDKLMLGDMALVRFLNRDKVSENFFKDMVETEKELCLEDGLQEKEVDLAAIYREMVRDRTWDVKKDRFRF